MVVTAVIAAAGTVSAAADLKQARLTAIAIPALFTGTAMTFQVSVDGETYQALYDDAGSAVTLTVAAGKTTAFKVDDASCLAPWRYIKVVSGSTESVERTVQLWCR